MKDPLVSPRFWLWWIGVLAMCVGAVVMGRANGARIKAKQTKCAATCLAEFGRRASPDLIYGECFCGNVEGLDK